MTVLYYILAYLVAACIIGGFLCKKSTKCSFCGAVDCRCGQITTAVFFPLTIFYLPFLLGKYLGTIKIEKKEK